MEARVRLAHPPSDAQARLLMGLVTPGPSPVEAGLSTRVSKPVARLYDDVLIYRGKRLVNWDPKLGSAVSDLEVESEEETGTLWEIRYPLVDGSGAVPVATTRPETMLGDVAVAVNPDD